MAAVYIMILAAAPARAAELECGQAQAGVVIVDGLLDDWQGVAGWQNSSGASGDAGVHVKCNYDEETLYLAVNVTDERIIRSSSTTKTAGAGEDHVSLYFGSARLDVWPALDEKKAKRVARWSTGDSLKSMQVVDSLQQKGWAVELGIPLARVPGGGKRATLIPFNLEFHDADLASEGKTQTVVTIGDGLIVFDSAAAMYQEFLTSNKLKAGSLRADALADVDGEPGLERVVSGGRVIAVVGAEYSYIELPAKSGKDVLEVRVVDLAGEGKSSILARYVERGPTGSREVLGVWNLATDGAFARTFAHEIGKEMGKNRLTNTWELAGKTTGKGKKKQPAPGYDLVIRAGEAVGFTAETWGEVPAEDMQPILLPWAEPKERVWRFSGDEVSGG